MSFAVGREAIGCREAGATKDHFSTRQPQHSNQYLHHEGLHRIHPRRRRFDSAMGLSTYLKELPNGDSFSQELGHPDSDSSQYTKFATAFAAAGHSWTTDFCGDTFPGSDMTNGAAFGDPCCTWAKGGTPDFTVTAFTTTPGEATVCASTTDTTETPENTVSPATEAPATTEAPITTAPPVTDSPSTTDAPAYTDAPAATTAPTTTAAPATITPSRGGCAVKSDSSTQSYRRFRH